MELNNKLYDFLRDLTMIYLPALGTLYFALSSIWNLPYGEQVVGTITAICAFLGTCLKINNYHYNKPYQIDIYGYIDDEEVEAKEVE